MKKPKEIFSTDVCAPAYFDEPVSYEAHRDWVCRLGAFVDTESGLLVLSSIPSTYAVVHRA